MRDQQKGLKRLRKASATFSLGSPSEILLVGYPSGVHYTWPSQGSPQANRLLTVPTRVFCAEIRYSIPPSLHPIDLIKSECAQRAPDNLGGLSLGHRFVSGSVWECLQVLLFLHDPLTRCPLILGIHISREFRCWSRVRDN